MDADRRTTPTALRLPVLGALAAVALYFAACLTQDLAERKSTWAIWGGWQMFTVGSWWNTVVEADAWIDGAWQPMDLEALFPSQFESGPRYRNIKQRGRAMDVLADSACDRDPRQPEKVRIVLVKWKNRLGVSPHLRPGATREPVMEWACSRTARRPGGVRL